MWEKLGGGFIGANGNWCVYSTSKSAQQALRFILYYETNCDWNLNLVNLNGMHLMKKDTILLKLLSYKSEKLT